MTGWHCMARLATPRMVAALLAGLIASPVQAQRQRVQDENAVVIALIDSVYKGKSPVVLREWTWSEFSRESNHFRIETLIHTAEIDSALVADYQTVNKEPRSLRRLMAGQLVFEVLDDTVSANFPRQVARDSTGRYRDTYWAAFHARFPGRTGIVRVSRPGFNAARTVALVDTFWGCGGLCGHGGLYVLHRIDGVWRIVAQPVMSVS